MKKRIYAVVTVLVLLVSLTTVTAFAKTFKDKNVERKMAQGYTKEEVYSMLAIISLSDENSMPVIEEKYKELGSFDAVREYYGISSANFETNLKNMMELEEKTEIPDEIYNEMIASGMTEDECYKLAISAINGNFDIETVWEGKKNGKSVNDLIKERKAVQDAKGQAAADYVFGRIEATDYTQIMNKLSPEMSIGEILDFAQTEKKSWMKFRKATSGITDEELEMASKAGIKDFFEACKMKDAEKLSNISFKEMLNQVEQGKNVNDVIKANVSIDKVEREVQNSNTDTE